MQKTKNFKRRGRFWVYIVECADKTLYTGYTNNLENRIKEHNNGKRGAKYLRGRTPVKLAYAKEYKHYRRAIARERKIKTLTRAEKQDLIRIYERATRPD